MKVIIQRVLEASVKVDKEKISSIGRGLLVLVGIYQNDTKDDMEYIVRKILNLKFFEGDNGKKWCQSVMDKQYEVLCVSQFTLCYSFKGNKLDFHNAMKADESQKFYESFLELMKKQYKPEMIKNGKFGAYMEVELCNDGPVTIDFESQKSVKKAEEKKLL